jgi:hypothetical protein
MDRVRGIDLVEAFIYYFESEEVSFAHRNKFKEIVMKAFSKVIAEI